MFDMKKKLNQIDELSEIMEIGFYIRADPEVGDSVYLFLKDDVGQYIYFYLCSWNMEKWFDDAIATDRRDMVNYALQKAFHIDNIMVPDASISTVFRSINVARRLLPVRNGVWINEKESMLYDYVIPEYLI